MKYYIMLQSNLNMTYSSFILQSIIYYPTRIKFDKFLFHRNWNIED